MPHATSRDCDLVLSLGLFFELAVMEIKLPSRGGIRILFDKFDTSAGLFGLSCIPAASLSGIFKVYVPKSLRQRVMNWYHFYLCHPGAEQLSNTPKQVYYWKDNKRLPEIYKDL